MSTVNKINFLSGKNYNSSYGTFKSTKEERIKDFQAQLAKQNYIATKTDTLEAFTFSTFILSLFLGAHNISLSRKLTTKEWFALGCFMTAIASQIALFIKGAQYAKEYDKEMKK